MHQDDKWMGLMKKYLTLSVFTEIIKGGRRMSNVSIYWFYNFMLLQLEIDTRDKNRMNNNMSKPETWTN